MKKFLLFASVLISTLSFANTPSIDGYIDPSEYDQLISVGDYVPCSFSVANCKEMYFAQDNDYYYLAARFTGDNSLTWAFIINNKTATGGIKDPRPKSVTYGHIEKPDMLMCGSLTPGEENYRVYTYSGAGLWATAFGGTPNIYRHNVNGFTDDGTVEIVIPKSKFGKFDLFDVQFYLSGLNPLNSAFDALPDDVPATSEHDQSILHNYANIPITLPVDLIDFRATIVNNVVKLSWEYENATNFKHFEIIRDNQVVGVTTANHFEDSKAIGYVTYKLKMVDNDGSFKYSKTVAIIAGVTETIKLVQNPAHNEIRLTFTGESKNYDLALYSMDGKRVASQIHKHSGSASYASISISSVSIGVYRLIAGSKSFNVIVQ